MSASAAPRLDAPLVLVTGGTGWLGARVVQALTSGLDAATAVTAGGHRVRCLVPAEEPATRIAPLGVELVRGDVRDEAALRAFTAGAEGALLLHLAGIIHPRRVADFAAINAAGTLGLLAAARQARVRRMVVMSSNSPIGCNPSPDHRFDEASPYHPYMGYGRSKHLMELGLRDAMGAPGGPEITILRAPWFYGPGQPPRQTLFFSMIRAGRFPLVGPGSNRRSMGYVDNLALGTLLAAAHPAARDEIFWLADAEPYAMRDIIDTVRQVLRDDFSLPVSDRVPRLPGIVGDVATIADWTLQRAGIYQQKIHVLSEMNKTIACDIGKARRMLSYDPPVALREGMRRSIAWCLENGLAV